MREITFSQTHRTTGARRRFVISQSDAAAEATTPARKRGAKPAAPQAWRYIAQLGDKTPWTESRWLDAPGDASDEEIRKKAIRDFNRVTSGRADS